MGSTSVVRRSQVVAIARPWAPFCVALRLVLRKRRGIFAKSGWRRVFAFARWKKEIVSGKTNGENRRNVCHKDIVGFVSVYGRGKKVKLGALSGLG